VNHGIVEARNGGAVYLQTGFSSIENPHWSNDGVFRVYPGSNLHISGNVAGSQLGQIQNLGGLVGLSANIDNTDRVWSPDFSGGEWILRCQIKGGTVNLAHPATVDGAVLDGVTVNGDLLLPDGAVIIKNYATVNGNIVLSGGDSSQVRGFLGNHRLNAGTIIFDNSTGGSARWIMPETASPQESSLTLGPGVTVRGGNGRIYTTLTASVINLGVISADVNGEAITIDTVRFSNQGTVQAINGGRIVYWPPPPLLDPSGPGDTLAFVNDGEFFAAAGGGFEFGCPLVLDPTSILRIDLTGGAFAESAALTAPSLTLGGTLAVEVAEGWYLRPGSSYRVFGAAETHSMFARVSLPDLDDERWWDVSDLDSGVISVVPEPLGLGMLLPGLVALKRRRRTR
jgi:hypothetical protein